MNTLLIILGSYKFESFHIRNIYLKENHQNLKTDIAENNTKS